MWNIIVFAFLGVLALSQGCVDTSDACQGWKESGYCVEYADQLKDLCPKSCGFCGGSSGGSGEEGSPGVAEDTRPAREPESPNLCRDTCNSNDCAWYKSQGHCAKYSAVMMMNCANTCGWCGARTCNPPKIENGWSDFEMVMIPAGAIINAFCYDGFQNYGSSQITCNDYGELDGSASCVEAAAASGEMTACQRAAAAAQEAAYKDGRYVIPQESTHYIPSCDYSGNFNQIQYDGSSGQTFCVDTFRGTEVQGTRIAGRHDYIDCTPGSAAEYYARLESEKQANAGYSESEYGSYGYDNSGYDTSNYDNSGYDASGYDASSYNYESSGYDSSDYSYESSGYDNSGYDNSGYESSGYESYESTDYDYSGDSENNYESSDYDYDAENSYDYEASYGGDGVDTYDYYNYDTNSDYDYGDYGSDLETTYYEVEGDPYYNTYYSDNDEVVAEEEGEEEEGEMEGGIYYAASEEEGGIGDIDAAEDEKEEEIEEEEAEGEEAASNKDRRRRRKMRKFRNKRSADLNEE